MTERILRALAREVVGEVRARRRRVVRKSGPNCNKQPLLSVASAFLRRPPSRLPCRGLLRGPGIRETRMEISCNVQGPQFCIYIDIIRCLLRCHVVCSRIYHRPAQERGRGLVVTSSVCVYVYVYVEHDWNGDVKGGWNELGASEINFVFRFFFLF